MEKVRLGGKDYEMSALDVNDLIELEERLGDLKQFKNGTPLTFKQARMLIWVLVRKSDPGLTEKQVGSFLVPTDKSFEETMQSINKGVVFGGGLKPKPSSDK